MQREAARIQATVGASIITDIMVPYSQHGCSVIYMFRPTHSPVLFWPATRCEAWILSGGLLLAVGLVAKMSGLAASIITDTMVTMVIVS